MTFSIIGVLSLVHLISLLFSGVSATLLYRAYRIHRNPLVGYFMWFFVLVFIWMAAYFVTLLLTTGTFTKSAGWELATSHGFFLIGLAFLARIVSNLEMPKYEKPIFSVTLVAAILITILGLILRVTSTAKEANPTIIQISAVLTVLVLVPSLLLMFYRGLKSDNDTVQIRSFLLGTGFALLLWHGISLVLFLSQGPLPWLVGEALNVFVFAVLLTAVLYRSPGSPEISS